MDKKETNDATMTTTKQRLIHVREHPQMLNADENRSRTDATSFL